MSALHKPRKAKSAAVCVIGLGYVGLPLAYLCCERGIKTTGFDIEPKKLDLIHHGKSPFKGAEKDAMRFKSVLNATSDPSEIKNAEVVIVCVPTPINEHYYPDYTPLIGAIETISTNTKKGQLISVESTVNPGTMEEIVKPILEKKGLKDGSDYFLVHCPERVDPGNTKWNVRNIPRVIGSTTSEGLSKGIEFYNSILDGEIVPMSSIKAAEAVKIVENTFRDVNIAFVNELAKSFDLLGIDTVEVIKGASTKPFAFLAHYPGCGVGGHCIPVDPYYLIERAKETGFNHEFLKLAREINNSMPHYTVDLLIRGLNEAGRSVKGSKIGVLGLAYKGGIDDVRESPAFKVISELKRLGAHLLVFDPYVPQKSSAGTLEELLEKSEAIVLLTNHPEFRDLDKNQHFKNVKVVIDGKNFLNKERITKRGLIYKGIGR